MKNWYKKLYNKLSELAETKWGPLTLLLSAFADASFFPLPVTTLFLILLLLNKERAIHYVFFIVLGTMTGAIAGYLIGHYAWLKPDGDFTAVGHLIFNHVPGFTPELYVKVHDLFTRWGFWIICSAAATPIPFGIFSITAGIANINIFVLLLAILISQGIKFALLAFLTLKIGPDFKRYIQFKWKPVAVISSIGLVIILVFRIF